MNRIDELLEVLTEERRQVGILLKRSEERMDTTNQMIGKLSDAVDNMSTTMKEVTEKYMYHLDEVILNRNHIQSRYDEALNQLKDERRRNDELVDRVIALCGKQQQGTQFNIGR